MSTSFNDICKQGYVKFKSKKIGVWQKRWVIFRKASSKGPRRLEKYPEEKHAVTGQLAKWIELSSVRSVSRLPNDTKKFAVAIHFYDSTVRSFCCESDVEANDWEMILKTECMQGPPIMSGVDLLDSGPNMREEMIKHERFHVCLLPSMKLDLNGECLMQITPENLIIYDVNDYRKCLASWPLNCLRRYGRDDTKFTFESGRHCQTGEGLFIFNTLEGEKIYQRVHQATLHIAEAHRIFNWQQQQMGRTALGPSRSLPSTPTEAPTTRLTRTAKHARTMPLPPVPNADPNAPDPPPRQFARGPKNKPLPKIPSEDLAQQMAQQTLDDSDSDSDDKEEVAPSIVPEEYNEPLSHAQSAQNGNTDTYEDTTSPTLYEDTTEGSMYDDTKAYDDSLNNNQDTKMTTSPLEQLIPPGQSDQTEDMEYIHEEKYFTPEFRKFLASRKHSDGKDS